MGKQAVLYLGIVVLIIIQFIRPAKNNHAGTQTNTISTVYPIPEAVRRILPVACLDCHSNHTIYPWYANLQPVAWYLNRHIVHGKEELNFDEFVNQTLRFQYGRFEAIKYQLSEDEMPLKSYQLLHAQARLTTAEKDSLINWCDQMLQLMRDKYPPDSLHRKRPH